MQKNQAYVRATLVRAQHFLDDNAAALGPVNNSGARKALDDAIAAFTDRSVAQGEHRIGSTGETSKQRSLSVALRKQYLRPIAKVAAARLSDVPEFSSLRMPKGNIEGQYLVDAAKSMANAATTYVDTFTAAGLKPDFLDALRAMVQQLETSLGGRTEHGLKRRSSTIALGSEANNGRKALNLLDAAIQQQIPDNAQLLAEWKSAMRIPKKPVNAGASQSSIATPVAPAPVPAAPAVATPTPEVTAAA
jgi:hypothetical protein